MKGTSFQNGIEFKVQVDGETWAQGDVIQGKLEAILRNTSGSISSAEKIRVCLAEGIEKKVKQKSADAFTVLAETDSPQSPLSWSFPLSNQAKVTDKNGSLYLLYGNSKTTEGLAHLKLNVIPHPHLRDFLDVLNTHFRFILKSIGNSKDGWLEVKFDAPSAREWTFLEQLALFIRIEGAPKNAVEVNFQFHRAEVDAMKAGLTTKKVKKEITRSLDLSTLIHDFNQRLNKDAAISVIEQIFMEYRDGGWLQN